MWPIDTANASTNWLLAKLRTMLDSLRASLEEHRPLDSWEHEEAVEEHAAELAEGNQEMLAEMAEFDPFEPEPGQDQGVIEADQQKEEAEEGQEKEVLESFQEKEVLESIQEKEEPEAGQERDINGFHGGEALPIRLPEAKVQDFADVHGAGKFEGSPRGDARLSLIESLREPSKFGAQRGASIY